jgi:hypothetical protein
MEKWNREDGKWKRRLRGVRGMRGMRGREEEEAQPRILRRFDRLTAGKLWTGEHERTRKEERRIRKESYTNRH